MKRYIPITAVTAIQVLDSRGNPTVEVEVTAGEHGVAGETFCGRAMVPSGASTGKFEAVELRDGGTEFGGLGVRKAVEHVNEELAEALIGENVLDQAELDSLLLEADGTENKERLGANAILGVSLAAAKAAAAALRLPLYQYLGGISARHLPMPMMNILNGGAHSDNSIDIQEFMILPMGAPSFEEGIRWCTEVYHSLKRLLKTSGYLAAVGDEGGFAPNLGNAEEAIELILEAVRLSGYRERTDFCLALDAASSEWKNTELGCGYYSLPKARQTFDRDQLLDYWLRLADSYPILSLEDPMDEEDWEGWRLLTEKLGGRVRLVGDDLFVTNKNRLQRGITEHCGNSILIKPNQIGTLTETFDTCDLAAQNGFTTILSHRSGDTEDSALADLAVGLGSAFIKTGAPCRGERTAKYNQLLRIAEALRQPNS